MNLHVLYIGNMVEICFTCTCFFTALAEVYIENITSLFMCCLHKKISVSNFFYVHFTKVLIIIANECEWDIFFLVQCYEERSN